MRMFRSVAVKATTPFSFQSVQTRRVHLSLQGLQQAVESGGADGLVKGGFVQTQQLDKLLRSQGCNLSPTQLQEMMAVMDENHDGKVSLAEFRNFLYPVDFEGGSLIATDESSLSSAEARALAAL